MTINNAVISGAKQIIRQCLGLNDGHYLLIFVDETTIEVGAIVAETAEDLNVQTTIIYEFVSLQHQIPGKIDLSLLVQAAAKEVRAILTCVNSLPECLPFRTRILETQWSARTRIGHMPGANLKVLQLANVDFKKLIEICHNLEISLARGRDFKLLSLAKDGTTHQLSVDIGGWKRLPVASDGIITDGVWGNVPSGETYIAPIEGSAEGSVVIIGSIPGMVVKRAEQIVLYFKNGNLEPVEPNDNRVAEFLHEMQIKPAVDAGDENWNNLAEIGIGYNPAVNRLTGNMLFDEKAAGNAHIALGSNSFMGGLVDSLIHCDMVIRASTIIVDEKTILQRGQLRFNESDWRESYLDVSLEKSPLQTATSVARSGIEVSFQNRLLSRVLRPEPGRVSACAVGTDETSRLALVIYELLPIDSEWIEIKALVSSSGVDLDKVFRVLHLLWEYGLINYR